MIPEAAIEAVSRHYSERTGVVPNAAWMRELLEAAAPHMLAEAKADAWDEGATGGLSWNEALGEDFETPNPYR